jgi:FAD/FMN-containing dehydrogenase
VVGVAGLLLSGGLSFLSAQHGLAADNILELETVFPNGTISNVNAQSNPTLFRAMKGSNTQFGKTGNIQW